MRPMLMPPSRRAASRKRSRRRRWRRVAGTLLVLAIAVCAAFALRLYWRRAALESTIKRGLAALASADSPTALVDALDRWEEQTASRWHHRRDDLLVQLLSEHPLHDVRVRTLLTRVTGADYGDRREDWQQWIDTRERLKRGEQPQVSRRQRVKLKQLWEAPIGLTAWFTTIIPLDGQVYVASLGSAFEDVSDAADGIVRVDGTTGDATLLFQPTEGHLRDVLGIAAGQRCLFATCRNGYVYCVDSAGTLRWTSNIDSPPAGPPLSLDINVDGVCDVIVPTSSGRVIALSGRNGRTVWTTSVATGTSAANALGVVLAAGAVIDDSNHDILATFPGGEACVLAARSGRARWHGTFNAGSSAGPLVYSGPPGSGPPAYVADHAARVWSLDRAGGALTTVPAWNLLAHRDEGIIAAPRTLSRNDRPPTIIACPTGWRAGRTGLRLRGRAGCPPLALFTRWYDPRHASRRRH